MLIKQTHPRFFFFDRTNRKKNILKWACLSTQKIGISNIRSIKYIVILITNGVLRKLKIVISTVLDKKKEFVSSNSPLKIIVFPYYSGTYFLVIFWLSNNFFPSSQQPLALSQSNNWTHRKWFKNGYTLTLMTNLP